MAGDTDMSSHHDRRPASPGVALRALLVLILAISAGACDSLLDVQSEPHSVPGDALERPSALEARMIGAEANFFMAYDMAIVYGGLFADELFSGGNSLAVEERRVTESDGGIGAADENEEGIDGLWTPMQRAAFTSNDLQADILAGFFEDQTPDAANSEEVARMSLFAGYTKLALGELFCSTAFNGTGPELTSAETYQLAVDEFTVAIDAADAEEDVRNAALVGRARAHLHLGETGLAAADASAVPADWEYIAEVYSSNSQAEENDIWNMLTDSQRYTVDPRFRFLTIDDSGEPDPRVDVFHDPEDPVGSDGSTELYQARKYLFATAPIRLAAGVEAQYILAEIAAAEGDPQDAVDIINAVRAAHGITQAYTPVDVDDRGEVLAAVLDEKGRTLFLEGQRMGDLRRFRAQHGLDLFPTGENYQDNVCMPLPNAERDNNPDI
jgi:SusD family